MGDMTKFLRRFSTKRKWPKECLSEFIGTFILIFVGNSSVAQAKLSLSSAGNMLSINFAYGFAVFLGVLAAGEASGAHLNPAVTVALAVIGKFPWKRIPHYMISQYLGAFTASIATFAVYYDALYEYEKGPEIGILNSSTLKDSAQIWATYPAPFVSLPIAFVDQILGTFILMFSICAIIDKGNMEVPKYLVPLYVAITVIVIGMSLGLNCGYAINPARDLAPRIFVTLAGWGTDAFIYRQYWWVTILGPHLGAIIGALTYMILIEAQRYTPGSEEFSKSSVKESAPENEITLKDVTNTETPSNAENGFIHDGRRSIKVVKSAS